MAHIVLIINTTIIYTGLLALLIVASKPFNRWLSKRKNSTDLAHKINWAKNIYVSYMIIFLADSTGLVINKNLLQPYIKSQYIIGLILIFGGFVFYGFGRLILNNLNPVVIPLNKKFNKLAQISSFGAIALITVAAFTVLFKVIA